MMLKLSAMGPLFLVLSLFFLPLSSTLRSVFISLAVVAFLLDKNTWGELKALLQRPWMRAVLALVLLAMVGCVWSEASLHQIKPVLLKYTKLLYLPFFVIGFQDKGTRQAAIHAFLLAMCITAVLLIIKSMGFIQYGGPDPGKLFLNHIMTGAMLALASYFAASFAYTSEGIRRGLYTVLMVLLSYTVIFVCTGRMAYLAYAIVMMVWFFQYFKWQKAMLWGSGFLLCFILSYQLNPTMQFLAHQAQTDLASYKTDDKNTSLGLRLQFHGYAYQLFKEKPGFGHGTGSFSALFDRDRPVKNWEQGTVWEPHSQYWLMASEYGILGLALLLLFIFSLFWESLEHAKARAMSLAIILPFLLGSLTDSLLLYSGTGYCFLLFMGMALGAGLKSSSTLYSLTDAVDALRRPWLRARAGETQT